MSKIFVLLIGLALIFSVPVSALKIGNTPTPTPTPTPQIVYVTVLVTPVPTTTVPTPVPTPLPGSGLWKTNQLKVYPAEVGRLGVTYVARGDGAVISRTYPNATLHSATVHKEVHFWLFGTQSNLDKLLDYTDIIIDSQGAYHIYLTPSVTSGLTPGIYYAVVQSAGANGKMDVTYNANQNRLESIYTYMEATPLAGDSPGKTREKLLAMTKEGDWCDDQIEEFELRVEDPWVSIDDSYTDWDEENPTMYLAGATNLGNSNQLTIILDPDNQITPKEIERATRTIKVEQYTDPMYPRNLWHFNFSTSGLYPGDHEILLKCPKFGIEVKTKFTLVEDKWPILTPTPTPKRYITGFPDSPTPNVTKPPVGQLQYVNSPDAIIPISTTEVASTGDTSISKTGDTAANPYVPTPDVTQAPTPAALQTVVGAVTTSGGSYAVEYTLGQEPTMPPETTPTKRLLLNANPNSPIGSSLQSMPLEPAVAILGLLAAFVVMRRE